MSIFRLITLALILIVTTGALPATSAPKGEARTYNEQAAEQFVRNTTDRLLKVIAERRGDYHKNPKQVEQTVADVLEDAVDFAGVARGVLGSHLRRLSDAQVTRFEKVFTTTLISVVTDALVSLRPRSINLRGSQRLRAGAVRVPMYVDTEDGQTFELSYTLMQDGSTWRVRNVVIDGINLGMTYRSQFNSLVQRHGGDASAAIDAWDTVATDIAGSVTDS